MLVPFPIAFLIGTLLADLAFWSTRDPFWVVAGAWLVGAGVAGGALAALAGLTDFLGSRRVRALRVAWIHFLGQARSRSNVITVVGHSASTSVAHRIVALVTQRIPERFGLDPVQ
jgi:uncharacterized membrane protein